jgi:hypothetical protein
MIPHARSAEHYARIARERLPGEPFLDALLRVAVADAMEACGSANAASKLLGVSRQTVGRHVDRERARKVNAEIGRPDLNQTQRGREWTERRERAAQRKRDSMRLLAAGNLG